MNFSVIKRTLGWLLLFEGIFLLVPTITGLFYQEWETLKAILQTIIICAVVGGICLIGKPKKDRLYTKEGVLIVALSWIVLSLFGALPFFLSGEIPNYIDALFETVSGFTTTGATIMSSGEAVEALPKCLLMWRSFTHWVGGMGVLVFMMAFLPLSGAQNLHIMKAESPGPSVSKLVPKVRTTALILYAIYTGLTVLEFIFLIFDMPLFDAITTAFATAGTGGFAIKADGFAGYSPYIQWVVIVFMFLFSINFNSYFLILCKRFKDAFSLEVRTFIIIVLGAITLIVINLSTTLSTVYEYALPDAIRHAAFSVSSVISTTGFATVDFNLWPAFSKCILVICMFIGACAGSTGGGMKVSRWILLYKGARHEMQRALHPKQVKKISMDGHIVEHEVVRNTNAYIIVYIFIFLVSLLLVSLDYTGVTHASGEVAYDALVTNFTAVTATINNIGPGLGAVGPVGSFAFYSGFSKIVFIFNMLAGRLEIFPMLLWLTPMTGKR